MIFIRYWIYYLFFCLIIWIFFGLIYFFLKYLIISFYIKIFWITILWFSLYITLFIRRKYCILFWTFNFVFYLIIYKKRKINTKRKVSAYKIKSYFKLNVTFCEQSCYLYIKSSWRPEFIVHSTNLNYFKKLPFHA